MTAIIITIITVMRTLTNIEGGSVNGGLDLRLTESVYRLKTAPPLAANLLRHQGGWRCFPTDIGGGLRGGDQVNIRIDVGPGQNLYWTPAANSFYFPSSSSRKMIHQNTRIKVGPGASLFFLPKPQYAVKDAEVRSRTRIDLDPHGQLFFLDIWGSGRIYHGESWCFRGIENSLVLKLGDQTLYQERWHLEGGVLSRSPAAWRGFSYLWTVFCYGLQGKQSEIDHHWENQFSEGQGIGEWGI
jgi:urease accessory protein UreH